MEGNRNSQAEQIEALQHAAANCRHMLQIVERKLTEAEQLMRDGQHDACRDVLQFLQQTIPEAIATLDPAATDVAD